MTDRIKGPTRGGVFWVKGKDGKKKWGVDFRDPLTHKRRRILIGTREQAIVKRDEIRLQAKGLRQPRTDVMFEDAVGQYLGHRRAQGKGARSYRFLKKDWPGAFRGRKVASITSEEIEGHLVRWMTQRKWSPATRNQALAQLSGFFSFAYAKKWIDVHPTEKGRVARLAVRNERTRWLRLEELEAIREQCPDWMKPIHDVAVKTGMRLGEICGLTRSSFQVDALDRAYLAVDQTKNQERFVWPVEGRLRETVEAAVARARFPGAYLFPGPKGGNAMMSIRRAFPQAVEAAGLRYGRKHPDGVTFHTYRHSMASLALNAGVSKSTVQRMGNWKSPAMVNRYAHLADETLREAAKKVDELVEKPGKDKPDTDCSEPAVHYAA